MFAYNDIMLTAAADRQQSWMITCTFLIDDFLDSTPKNVI